MYVCLYACMYVCRSAYIQLQRVASDVGDGRGQKDDDEDEDERVIIESAPRPWLPPSQAWHLAQLQCFPRAIRPGWMMSMGFRTVRGSKSELGLGGPLDFVTLAVGRRLLR